MQKNITDFARERKVLSLNEKHILANEEAWKKLGYKSRKEGIASVKIKKNKSKKSNRK